MWASDLEVLYGAASEAGYKKLMEVMEGLGEAILLRNIYSTNNLLNLCQFVLLNSELYLR